MGTVYFIYCAAIEFTQTYFPLAHQQFQFSYLSQAITVLLPSSII